MRIKPPLAQARISAARRKSQPGTDFARVRTKIQQEKVRKAQSRTVKRNPDFGVCGVVTTILAVCSGAKTHMRRARVLEGYPDLGTCGAVITTIAAAVSGTGTPMLPEAS